MGRLRHDELRRSSGVFFTGVSAFLFYLGLVPLIYFAVPRVITMKLVLVSAVAFGLWKAVQRNREHP